MNNVNFSVHVGTVVPERVRIATVPSVLIDIHPAWRDHRYFVVRDEIVIVDHNRHIVAVLPVSSGKTVGSSAGRSSSSSSWSVEEIRQVQVALKDKGYDIEVDGVLGPRTKDVLIQFQQKQGFEATGRLDSRTTVALGISSGREGGNNGGPSTTGQGGGNMRQSPDQNGNAAQHNDDNGKMNSGAANKDNSGAANKGSKEPSTTGRGDKSSNKDQNDKPSTTGQGNSRMQPSSSDQDAGQDQSAKDHMPSQQQRSGGSKSEPKNR